MSVQNPQLAGFLLTGNRSNFLYVEGSTALHYDCQHFLYTKVTEYISKILLFMLTQLQDKLMTMLLLLHVKIIIATLLN